MNTVKLIMLTGICLLVGCPKKEPPAPIEPPPPNDLLTHEIVAPLGSVTPARQLGVWCLDSQKTDCMPDRANRFLINALREEYPDCTVSEFTLLQKFSEIEVTCYQKNTGTAYFGRTWFERTPTNPGKISIKSTSRIYQERGKPDNNQIAYSALSTHWQGPSTAFEQLHERCSCGNQEIYDDETHSVVNPSADVNGMP